MCRLGVVYLPHRPSIFPYLAPEVNLRLGAWRDRGERGRVDDLVSPACDQLPVLQERRGQPTGTLSGGHQRQIARSLMHDPVLFLTTGAEPRVAALIHNLIRGLAGRDKTVLHRHRAVGRPARGVRRRYRGRIR